MLNINSSVFDAKYKTITFSQCQARIILAIKPFGYLVQISLPVNVRNITNKECIK